MNAAFKTILCGVVICAASLCQDRTFRVDVQLVRILATVKDSAGRLVPDLERNSFAVYDNGVKQEIKLFEKHTSQPLSVAMMVDISGSTAKELKYETESVARFFHALLREGNPDDRTTLFSFNFEVVQHTDFTRDLMALERKMKSFHAEAGTAMYDAIYFGSRSLARRDGRHVMVLVTDGGDTTSSTTYHKALRELHDSDTVFYAILVMPITNDVGRNIGGENALTTLTQSTGGRVFAPSLGRDLDSAFDDILRDLRTQYLLGYYPKDIPLTKEHFHRIEIRMPGQNLRVISRTGYYGEAIH
jgi:Ca-activated chloride channel family protein